MNRNLRLKDIDLRIEHLKILSIIYRVNQITNHFTIIKCMKFREQFSKFILKIQIVIKYFKIVFKYNAQKFKWTRMNKCKSCELIICSLNFQERKWKEMKREWE